jgi:hypothetical protein
VEQFLRIPPFFKSNYRICFGWKLGLVSVALLPITVMTGYLRFSLLNKLNVQLREAYESSANIACEQVAAIRTVASLNREIALHTEFATSLRAPVRKALNSTLKITFVASTLMLSNNRLMPWDKVWDFSRMHWCFGTVARSYVMANTPSLNSSFGNPNLGNI